MQEKIILLVEDDPDDVELILRSLKKYNISNKVTVVSDGQEVLDYLFTRGAYANLDREAMPAVVLLDIKLPKIDGIEVLRRLRADERTKLLPVVMLTSSREQQDLVNSYKYGCNSYVRKPIEFNEFAEAVSKLGLYWLLINEAPPHIKTPRA